ncbi:MAG TPA: AAA family ATPase [Terriglobia bacterium]|nr:AAA family ATPase [Terriglobia bacterium]
MFLEFYNLKEQPFGVTPDPAFLFMSRTHREALASLYYSIEAGCGFAALIAAPGMGKTTLLFQLLERLRGSHRTAFLFQTQCNSREFLGYLLTDLGQPPTNQDVVLMHRQLSDLLVAQARDGKRFVVFIDEGQNLEEEVLETLRLLSDFETPRRKLIQIILAGQPQLAVKLSRRSLQQLRQRISTVARLSVFSVKETHRYIAHRLKVAGYEGPPLFTEAAYSLIAKKSRGIPRLINTLCFNALSLGFADGQKTIDGTLIKQVLADLDISLLFPEAFSAYDTDSSPAQEEVSRAGRINSPLLKGDRGLSPGKTPSPTSGPRIVPGPMDETSEPDVPVPGILIPEQSSWISDPGRTAAGILCFVVASCLIIIFIAMIRPSAQDIRQVSSVSGSQPGTMTAETPQKSTTDNSPLEKGARGLSQSEGGKGVVSGGPSVNGSHGDLYQPNPARQYQTVLVEQGDTLRQICLRYLGPFSNRLVEQIMVLNPHLKAPNHLDAGQRLRLPLPAVREMMVISGTDEPVGRTAVVPVKDRK